MSKVIIYGDISLDAIDGSSIWLASISEVLAELFDQVHLQLKVNPTSDRLLSRLKAIPNLTIHPNYQGDRHGRTGLDPLSPQDAAEVVGDLVQEINADAVVARGFDISHLLSQNKSVAQVLWSYITDLPYPLTQLSRTNVGRLQSVALRSRRMFAQTEAARSYLEEIAPQAAGKTALLPPMVPDYAFNISSDSRKPWHPGSQLQLVYSGKLAKDWKSFEILDLPTYLRAMDIDARLTIIGDKYLEDPKSPAWLGQMRQAMERVKAGEKYNVRWLGGIDRREAICEMAKGHLGIGWRSSELDSSLEISTKALEYSAAGLPTLLNYSSDHVNLFGKNYPFFVKASSSTEDVAKIISSGLDQLIGQRDRVQSIASSYSFSAARERLREVFSREGSLVDKPVSGNHQKNLVVVSHDFKFMGELMDYFNRDSRLNVRIDAWTSLHTNDQEQTKRLASWAEVVLCEWAGPAAVWYSKNKQPGSRLYIRLHAFELRGAWIRDVNWNAVDKVIFVSEFYRQQAVNQLNIDKNDTVVIPNAIDVADFDRPKVSGADYNIGLVGMVGFGKRPDRALDCLERLLEYDSRYKLFVKSRPPWEYPYEWDRPVQRQLYLEFFSRIRQSERLRSSVIFDDFSPDMASWFRKIGYILSPSAFESFHLAPAEGMASGAVPVFWEREGVSEIFDGMKIVSTSSEAADYIAALNKDAARAIAGCTAQDYAERWDFGILRNKWDNLVHLDSAVSSTVHNFDV